MPTLTVAPWWQGRNPHHEEWHNSVPWSSAHKGRWRSWQSLGLQTFKVWCSQLSDSSARGSFLLLINPWLSLCHIQDRQVFPHQLNLSADALSGMARGDQSPKTLYILCPFVFFLVNLTRNEEHKRVVNFIYVMKAGKELFVWWKGPKRKEGAGCGDNGGIDKNKI